MARGDGSFRSIFGRVVRGDGSFRSRFGRTGEKGRIWSDHRWSSLSRPLFCGRVLVVGFCSAEWAAPRPARAQLAYFCCCLSDSARGLARFTPDLPGRGAAHSAFRLRRFPVTSLPHRRWSSSFRRRWSSLSRPLPITVGWSCRDSVYPSLVGLVGTLSTVVGRACRDPDMGRSGSDQLSLVIETSSSQGPTRDLGRGRSRSRSGMTVGLGWDAVVVGSTADYGCL